MGFYFENEFTKSFLKAIFEDINNRKLSLYLKGQKVKRLILREEFVTLMLVFKGENFICSNCAISSFS